MKKVIIQINCINILGYITLNINIVVFVCVCLYRAHSNSLKIHKFCEFNPFKKIFFAASQSHCVLVLLRQSCLLPAAHIYTLGKNLLYGNFIFSMAMPDIHFTYLLYNTIGYFVCTKCAAVSCAIKKNLCGIAYIFIVSSNVKTFQPFFMASTYKYEIYKKLFLLCCMIFFLLIHIWSNFDKYIHTEFSSICKHLMDATCKIISLCYSKIH